MKITEITESINFYDRFGHDTGPQTRPYTVEVRDRETGGKKLISVQAVSAADARERARDRGYRVVRVVSQDEQGVAEGGPFSYGAKKPRKGSVADLAAKKRQEQERGKQPIEPRDQRVGVARVTKGIQEGFMDTLKGAAREFTRDSMQKKIKQAWENTFWPQHIEPALNRIQIDGQPFRRMVLGEPRVIENDRSKNAIFKQYTVNIVFPIDPQQWAGDEIRYLEAQLRDIEDGDWNPKVHGLGLVSFDQPMKSFQYTKGSVPDLVIPVRITSLDINRSLVGEQGVSEGSEEQVYKVVAVDKSNALKKPTKLNVKASSIEDVFSRLAANDWYALSINGVEVIAGKRLKQGVAEGHADQQRTIVKRNGEPVGEVGIDRESSPGAGQYYMKHYASGTDNSGYDSREEALGDLRHIMKQSVYGELREQGVAEGQLDFYRLERLDPQTRRVLTRMADHAQPGSWLSASEAYAMMLGLQYKSRDPRGWEQEVQGYVDLWNEITGKKS